MRRWWHGWRYVALLWMLTAVSLSLGFSLEAEARLSVQQMAGACTEAALTITGTLTAEDLVVNDDVVVGDALDVAGDVTLTETGGSPVAPDLEIDGFTAFNGNAAFYDGAGDSSTLFFNPASGTSWGFFAEDTGDDLQLRVNTGATETFDIFNDGGGRVDVTIDGTLTLGNDFILENAEDIDNDVDGRIQLEGSGGANDATLNVLLDNADGPVLSTGETEIGFSSNLSLADASGDSPLLQIAPQTGTEWSIFVEDTEDALTFSCDEATDQVVDIINDGAGVADLEVEGTVEAGTLTDGTLEATAGALTGVTTFAASDDITLSKDSAMVTHSGATALTVASTNGPVVIDNVTHNNGDIGFGADLDLISLAADEVVVNGDFDVESDFDVAGMFNAGSNPITIPDSGDGLPAEYNLTPATRQIYFSCSDADGCNINFQEGSASTGDEHMILNASANNVVLVDDDASLECNGDASMTLGGGDWWYVVYGADRYHCMGDN